MAFGESEIARMAERAKGLKSIANLQAPKLKTSTIPLAAWTWAAIGPQGYSFTPSNICHSRGGNGSMEIFFVALVTISIVVVLHFEAGKRV